MGIIRINELPEGSGSLSNDDIFIFMDDPSASGITRKTSLNNLRSNLLNQPAQLQLRQGLDAERLLITPASGEPIWTTDTQKLYIGDGNTPGGDLIGPVYVLGSGINSIQPSTNNNSASGSGCFIGGGSGNIVTGLYSSVCGGGQVNFKGADTGNTNNANVSFIGGGSENIINSGLYFTTPALGNAICCGVLNTIGSGNLGSIIGAGFDNEIQNNATFCSIAGGATNVILSGSYISTIGGGMSNQCGGYYCGINTGSFNSIASGVYYSVIGGGTNNTTNSNYSTIGGGISNNISGYTHATIGGGNANSTNNLYGVIGGGSSNTLTGVQYNTIGGGYLNACAGNSSTIGGGNNNTNNGYNCVIGGGGFNTTGTPYFGTIGGGSSNTISTSSSYGTIPGGSQAVADRYGMMAYAAGRFSANGDAQNAIFVLRCKTTTNSGVEMALDGGSSRLTVPSGKIISGTINIVGSKSDGASVARYLRQFTIKNVGGTTSLVGSIITLGTDEATGTSISITANNTNDYLSIIVTGITSETWRWVASVNAVEVAYGT